LVLYHIPHPNDGHPSPGRPPNKYNAELHSDIVEGIRQGGSPDNVARVCGIGKKMFIEWLAKGRDGDPWLKDFYADVEQAIGEWNMRLERVIHHGHSADGVDPIKVAERRDPHNWNREIRMSVDSQMNEFLARCAADPRLTHVFQAILEIAAGATGPAAFEGAEEGEE